MKAITNNQTEGNKMTSYYVSKESSSTGITLAGAVIQANSAFEAIEKARAKTDGMFHTTRNIPAKYSVTIW